jgi:energy-converting hydrogenase Eha subunit F
MIKHIVSTIVTLCEPLYIEILHYTLGCDAVTLGFFTTILGFVIQSLGFANQTCLENL